MTARPPWPELTEEHPLTAIRVERRLQARETTDNLTVIEYMDRVIEGEELPPIVVFRTPDGALLLVDGFHRYEAHHRARRQTIACEVRRGTFEDALRYAVGANAKHGLQRKPADKRRAITLLLEQPGWATASNRQIAEACSLTDHQLVGRVRRELAEASGVPVPTQRTGADGRTIDTSRIGQRTPPPAMPPDTDPDTDDRDGDGRALEPDGRRHSDHCVCPRCEEHGAGEVLLEDEDEGTPVTGPAAEALLEGELDQVEQEIVDGALAVAQLDEDLDADEQRRGSDDAAAVTRVSLSGRAAVAEPDPTTEADRRRAETRLARVAAVRSAISQLAPDRDELREVLRELKAADVRASVAPERRLNDAYYTPDYVALALTRWLRDHGYLPRKSRTRYLEGHIGGGAWFRAWRALGLLGTFDGLDVDEAAVRALSTEDGLSLEVGDFLAPGWEGDRRWDVIVGNPPFTDAEDHVRRALRLLAPRGILAWILRRDWIAAARGALIASGLAPVEEIVLEDGSPEEGYRRLSFTDDGKSDSREHSLYIWRQGAQRLHWRTHMLAIPNPKRGGSRAA